MVLASHPLEALAEQRAHLGDLIRGHDERGRNLQASAPDGPGQHPCLPACRRRPIGKSLVFAHRQLDRGEGADTTSHVVDHRQFLQGEQSLIDLLLEGSGPLANGGWPEVRDKRPVIGAPHDGPMPTTMRRATRGALLADRALRAIGEELRTARVQAGLSQRYVARAASVSASRLSRLERGRDASIPLAILVRPVLSSDSG